MTKKTKQRSRRGFTLMELVIAMALISVLTALVLPRVSAMISQAAYASFSFNHRTLESAIAGHLALNGNVLPQPFYLTEGAGRMNPVGLSMIIIDEFIGNPPGATYEWTIDTSVTPHVGVLTSTIPNPPPDRPASIHTIIRQAQ